MQLAEQRLSLHCEPQAVVCTLWLCSWICFTRKQSSWEAALAPRGMGWKQPFSSCFLDLDYPISYPALHTLCLPFTEPFGWRFAVCPRQALLCSVQLMRAAMHCCSGMPLPFSSAIRAAIGALWALSDFPYFSNFICPVPSCHSGLWGGETALLQPC